MKTLGSRSGSTASRRKKIALCWKCRREVLQREPGNHLKGTHRSAAKGMTKPDAPTAAAEKAVRRNERKARSAQYVRDCAILAALRSRNLHEAQRIVLEIKGEILPPAPIDEDCPECLKRQNAA